MEPWNLKEILQPPINTALCINNKIDVNDLRHALNSINLILTKQGPLHKESALLSRFLYKYDKKFRSDIGYKKFKMVGAALRKYLTLNLIKQVETFLEILPNNNEKNLYLPTRQMLEYLLVKIMSFSKLMSRVAICSKQSGIFYLNRIKNGDSHWMSLMPYALLCRIWSMSLVLLQHSCNWYNRLYSFLPHLGYKGLLFLNKGCTLPNDLAAWINLKNLSDEGRFDWLQKSTIDADSLLVENEDGDICDNLLLNVDIINSDKPKECDNVILLLNSNVTDDLGEKISRENFKQLTNKQHSMFKPKHSITDICNIKTLQKFLSEEEKYRNESSDLSETRHLSFMQWQCLKLAMLKLENGLMKDGKLKMKVQKIWKEKCLSYL